MEPCHAFESLAHLCKKLDLDKTKKERILGGINYFLAQSLCHEDRRDADWLIKAKWGELLAIAKGTFLIERSRMDRLLIFWKAVASLEMPSKIFRIHNWDPLALSGKTCHFSGRLKLALNKTPSILSSGRA